MRLRDMNIQHDRQHDSVHAEVLLMMEKKNSLSPKYWTPKMLLRQTAAQRRTVYPIAWASWISISVKRVIAAKPASGTHARVPICDKDLGCGDFNRDGYRLTLMCIWRVSWSV